MWLTAHPHLLYSGKQPGGYEYPLHLQKTQTPIYILLKHLLMLFVLTGGYSSQVRDGLQLRRCSYMSILCVQVHTETPRLRRMSCHLHSTFSL